MVCHKDNIPSQNFSFASNTGNTECVGTQGKGGGGSPFSPSSFAGFSGGPVCALHANNRDILGGSVQTHRGLNHHIVRACVLANVPIAGSCIS